MGGVKGATVYLVDTSIIGIQKLINKTFVDVRINTRSIHDIIWNNDKVTVPENFEITNGIVVGKDKLDKHTNYDLDVRLTMLYTSNKETM